MNGPLLDNRYQPQRVLGEGAMGQVLLVEDTLTRQHLALKIIASAAATDAKSVLQFQQEFRLMTRLRHPNCCAVTSYGLLADGAPYFTMEVVPGHGLDELLPMDAERFRAIFPQLLLALGYVHQQGFVHRDLKPANVRVKPDGTVKLMDFGLMEHAGRAGGAIVGTVPYLSPEIVKRGAVDARADLYSLGALAYEMLTGRAPFVRPTPMEVLRAHVGELPEPPSRVRAGIPADLERVVMRLLAKEPLDRYQSAYEVLEALGHVAPAGIGGTLLSASLVGRERELTALASRLGAVAAGQAVTPMVVWGPEGLGKTRLIEELRFQSELANVPFVMGKAYESGNFPYRHFVWILKSLLPAMRQHIPDALASLSPVLVKLLPELNAPAAPEMEAGQEKLRLQTAVTDAMLALARRQGYVVALENWQWAEPLSIELLDHLLRNLGDAPVFVLVGSRQAHAGATGLLAAERLVIAPLGPEDLTRMVGSMLGSAEPAPGFVEHVATLTEGNPLFVERLLEHLVKTGRLRQSGGRWQTDLTLTAADVPGGLQGLLAEKLVALSMEAVAVAKAGAVLGQVFELSVLRRMAGLPDEALFDALDELVTAQVLSPGDRGAYGFHQASYQAFFYGMVEPEPRLAMHATAIAALEEQLAGTPLTEAPMELVTALARHALIAGETDKAVTYALQAGLRSAELYANADAEEFLSAGLRQIQAGGGDRWRVLKLRFLHALGDVRRVLSNWPGARTALADAVPLATEFGDDEALGRILVSLAKVLQVQRELAPALDAATRGVEASLRVGARGQAARGLLTAARIQLFQGKPDEALASTERALALAVEGDDQVQQGSALGFLGYLHVSAGRGEESLGPLRESISLNEALGDRMGLHTALDYLANAQILRGEFQAASETLERKAALCHAIGYMAELGYNLANQALVALQRGVYPEAARLGREAADQAARQEDGVAWTYARLLEAEAAARLGQLGRATTLAAESAERDAAIANQYLTTELLPHHIDLALFLGDAPTARRHLVRWMELAGDTGAAGHAAEAEVSLLEGRADAARAAFEQARDAAASSGAQGISLRALLGLARAQVAESRFEDAERSAAEALALAERLGVVAPAAEAEGLLGELDLAFGRIGARARFEAMATLADTTASGELKARALFGLAAAAPYAPEAAQRVQEAKELLALFSAELTPAERARFEAPPQRARVVQGNHIDFSLTRVKKRDTGPLPSQGMWKMF
jgi:tetratricopeptide (TPR) repeat protein